MYIDHLPFFFYANFDSLYFTHIYTGRFRKCQILGERCTSKKEKASLEYLQRVYRERSFNYSKVFLLISRVLKVLINLELRKFLKFLDSIEDEWSVKKKSRKCLKHEIHPLCV